MKWLARIAAGALILGALMVWPYVYYQFLRVVICVIGSVIAWKLYESKSTAWSLVFGGIALLFNPIYPFYLDRSTWVVIDLISAGFFIWVSFLKFFKNSSEEEKKIV